MFTKNKGVVAPSSCTQWGSSVIGIVAVVARVAVVMVGRRIKVIKHIIMWFVCVLEWFGEGFEGVWKEFWKGFDGV